MLSLVAAILAAGFTLASAWALGKICLRARPAPAPVALAVGMALQSLGVFLLALAGAAGRPAFLLLGAAALLAGLRRGRRLKAAPREPADRATRLVAAAILAPYGLLYLVHALAPEIQPDAIAYHLGLVREYARLGGFPGRIGFFEILPQGLEMNFLFAYVFGGGLAAKLVHFALLAATAPLILETARRLGLSDRAGITAALFYLCAPVVGVSGTSAYTDAALVLAALAALYLLLTPGCALPAGVSAGFCYAIKLPGLLFAPLGLLVVLARPHSAGAALGTGKKSRFNGRAWLRCAGEFLRSAKAASRGPKQGEERDRALAAGAAVVREFLRRLGARPAVRFAAGALLVISPWMLRGAILTGNPVAPLFNAWFPNPYFSEALEQELARHVRESFVPVRALFDLAVTGRLQGMFGPILLAAPAGLLALRRPAGRWCWAAALALGLAWLWNPGARFLMPSFVFLALALAMVLPRRAAWAAAGLQAILCWPGVVGLYEHPANWRLRGFPLRAALGLESEPEYLAGKLDEFKEARLLEGATGAGERVFSLIPVARAFTTRETLERWHSSEAARLTGLLTAAARQPGTAFWELRSDWPPQALAGFRVNIRGQAEIFEIRLYSGEEPLYSSPQWRLAAAARTHELPLAFDGNPVTGWQAGRQAGAEFDRSQLASGAGVMASTPLLLEFEGRTLGGYWVRLPARQREPVEISIDRRPHAARAVRQAGFQYLLARVAPEGLGPIGLAFDQQPEAWGAERAAEAGQIRLFRIGSR